MAGELVPLVLLPRFTTLAGAQTFYTVAMDITAFEKALLNVWRGVMNGTSPALKITCQESTDQVTWGTCGGTSAETAVGEDAEVQFTPTFTKRWFRIGVKIEGTAGPSGTCWAVGFLEERLT